MTKPAPKSPRFALVVVSGAWGAFWGTWSALLPAVLERADATPGELGLVLTAVPVGAMPAMGLAGRIAVGREHRMLLLTTAALALGIVTLSGISGLGGLGIALFLVGATSGALDVCLNAATARAERVSGRPLFQAVHAAFPVAVITAAPLTGLARQSGMSIRAVLLLCAAALLGSVLPLLGPAAKDHARGRADPGGPAGPHWRSAWFWGAAIGVLGGCMLVVENAVEQWSVLLLEEDKGASAVLASAAPAVYMSALTVSRLVVQRLPRLRIRDLGVLAAVGGCGGFAWAAMASTAELSLAGFAVSGLAFGPLMPALLSHAGQQDASGYTVSVVSTVSYGAFLVSPLLVGSLTNWMSLPSALSCLAFMAVPLLGAAVGARVRPGWGQPHGQREASRGESRR
ncbi:MFS transporter [Streptomyces sp. NBS 14/10]|uniref:MFS transporter n=1 Tax=Streptomyces sp. NBS 14/10 TaxID=1945643 RepID=UPI0015C5C65A|nr:MFS transporter [Streptomyces sp. NBS 14/10]KAK1176837.1 MFS transporter [Streptomyces sp. NBS 14/10]